MRARSPGRKGKGMGSNGRTRFPRANSKGGGKSATRRSMSWGKRQGKGSFGGRGKSSSRPRRTSAVYAQSEEVEDYDEDYDWDTQEEEEEYEEEEEWDPEDEQCTQGVPDSH
jgi:hypothetical protein